MTSSGPFRHLLQLLVVCSACGGRSKTILADAGPADAGGHTANDAATGSNDASVVEPQDAGEDAAVRSCATETHTSGPPTEGAILAVPRSSVMAEALPGEARTRFDATRDSIVACLTGLVRSPFVGLVLNPADANCESGTLVEAQPLHQADQRERLVAELEAVTEPAGTASLLGQLRHARALADALPSNVQTALVLFMDGATEDELGCSAEQTIELLSVELRDTLEAGTQTPYLVATPGSGAGGLARNLAGRAGCPSCALDFSAQPDFTSLLSEVVSRNRAIELVCDFPIPVPAGGGQLDLDSVTVTLSLDERAPEVVPHRVKCDQTAGFTIEGDPGRIILCPATCAELGSSFAPTMTVDACAIP